MARKKEHQRRLEAHGWEFEISTDPKWVIATKTQFHYEAKTLGQIFKQIRGY